MLLGTSKYCINPQEKLILSGFSSRKTVFEKIEDDLYVRVHLFIKDNKKILFIFGDLLWWQSSFVSEAKTRISKQFEIDAGNIFFNASHNHCGPPTGSYFSKLLEKADDNYRKFLLEQVIKAVMESHGNVEQVAGRRIDNILNLNVYRRKIINNVVNLLPNYDVKADNNISLVVYAKSDGAIKAIGVYYTCHANICGENIVQPDYPGTLLSMLEEEYPNCICFFWQGCAADIRPNCVVGGEFVRQPYKSVIIFANQLFNKCKEMLKEDGYKFQDEVSVKNASLPLSLENVCTVSQAKEKLKIETDNTIIEWLKSIINNNCKSTVNLEISRISLAKELVVYTFSAEMSQYYAKYVRCVEKNALGVAYTNGMLGYISTAQQIKEGGYEPDESKLFFALAGTFPEEIENKIHTCIKELSLNK